MGESLLKKPHAFERGDKLYIVTPLAPAGPAKSEIEELAFSEELLGFAPNENIMWLKGAYAEADKPNANGQMWLSDELALKHLTPRLMPVTVMHDPRTAVGMIADTKLLNPPDVPRSRIETTLGIWAHRFPEIAEESMANYEAGTLMQSMECISPHYSCQECGKTFPKLPGGAEEEYWCAHLSGQGGDGVRAGRILGNVAFTGTGLIFGTRGSRGAYDDAHLDVFQDEVAEFHEQAHKSQQRSDKKPKRSKTFMDTIEIPRDEYAELQQRPSKDDLAAAEQARDEAIEAKNTAEKDSEAAEAAKVKAEGERDEAVSERDKLKDAEQASTLSTERLGKLGEGFTAKLGEKTKQRVTEQSKSLSDEEWEARLEELSELVGVEPDEGKPEGSGEEHEEFTAEELASAGVGRESTGGKGEASPQERASVFGSLLKA